MRTWVLAFVCVAVVYVVVLLMLAALGRRSAARQMAAFLPNLLTLFRGLIRDQRVPRGSKRWLIFAAVWISSPIDLVPEFIPGLGPIDDALVAYFVLRHLIRSAGETVVREHWRGDPSTLDALLRVLAGGGRT